MKSSKPERGWIFCKEGTAKEVGFASPDECLNAESAIRRFGNQYSDHFDLYFRDSHGRLNPTDAESTPNDYE